MLYQHARVSRQATVCTCNVLVNLCDLVNALGFLQHTKRHSIVWGREDTVNEPASMTLSVHMNSWRLSSVR